MMENDGIQPRATYVLMGCQLSKEISSASVTWLLLNQLWIPFPHAIASTTDTAAATRFQRRRDTSARADVVTDSSDGCTLRMPGAACASFVILSEGREASVAEESLWDGAPPIGSIGGLTSDNAASAAHSSPSASSISGVST